jgi:hypothetical protein
VSGDCRPEDPSCSVADVSPIAGDQSVPGTLITGSGLGPRYVDVRTDRTAGALAQ